MTQHNPRRPHLEVQLAMVPGFGEYYGPIAFTEGSKSFKAEESHSPVVKHQETWQGTRETFELVAS